MNKLRTILQPYARSVALGDPGGPGPSLAELRVRLDRVVRDNAIYLWICFAFTGLLFVVAMIVVLTNLNQPGLVQIAFAAVTATTGGAVYMMRALWREKVATEILMALCDAFDGDALRTVVDTFVRRLR